MGPVLTLAAETSSLRVDRARGGRLASLVAHGHELLVPRPLGRAPDPLVWGCYPMVPFAGRIRGGRFRWGGTLHEITPNHAGHAMHGTLFDERWLVEHASAGYLRLRGRLDPRWPFEGWAIQEISLSPDRLDLRLEVHTEGTPFPATAGWHPWFQRRLPVGGRLEVELDAKRWYPRGPDGLPLGGTEPPPDTGPWDDCFTALDLPVTLTWPGALEVSLTTTCDHIVLYDQQPHAVCVEPQSGPPDAVNLDLAHIVRRHDPLIVETTIAWRVP